MFSNQGSLTVKNGLCTSSAGSGISAQWHGITHYGD